MHFESPGIVLRLAPDDRAPFAKHTMELARVLDSDPDPRSTATLSTPAQVESAGVPRHVGKVLGPPLGLGEAEHVDVVPHAPPHVLDAEDRLDVLDTHLRGRHAALRIRLRLVRRAARSRKEFHMSEPTARPEAGAAWKVI